MPTRIDNRPNPDAAFKAWLQAKNLDLTGVRPPLLAFLREVWQEEAKRQRFGGLGCACCVAGQRFVFCQGALA